MQQGWEKIVTIAKYVDKKPRTISGWLKMGLPYSKVPGGSVLIKFSDVDEFLNKYKHNTNEIEAMVKDLMQGINGR